MKIHAHMSRTAQLQELAVGESTLYFPGTNPSYSGLRTAVSAAISTGGKDGERYSQKKGLLVVEGEVPLPVSIVTRTA